MQNFESKSTVASRDKTFAKIVYVYEKSLSCFLDKKKRIEKNIEEALKPEFFLHAFEIRLTNLYTRFSHISSAFEKRRSKTLHVLKSACT